jgi:hypothetical protein
MEFALSAIAILIAFLVICAILAYVILPLAKPTMMIASCLVCFVPLLSATISSAISAMLIVIILIMLVLGNRFLLDTRVIRL